MDEVYERTLRRCKQLGINPDHMTPEEGQKLEELAKAEDLSYISGKIEEYKQKGEWEKVCFQINGSGNLLSEIFARYYKDLPDNVKYELLIQLYTHNGDRLTEVRKEVRKALKYGSPQLPTFLAGQKIITVYRGGGEDISKAKYRMSWTTSLRVAEFFMKKYIYDNYLIRQYGYEIPKKGVQFTNNNYVHLYKGEIKREKIIAYTNSRKEEEIIQYRNVLNIADIAPKIIHISRKDSSLT